MNFKIIIINFNCFFSRIKKTSWSRLRISRVTWFAMLTKMMIGNISGKKSGMLLWHVSTSFEFLNVIFWTFEEQHHIKKCEMHLWFVLTSFEFKNVIFWTFKEHYRKHMRDNHQISANNSTPLRYSKKTWYSAITRVRIPSRIVGFYSTRVIFESEL